VVKAVWNGVTLAESDHTQIVQGSHYFPADSLRREYFRPSRTTTVCPWRGTASYYSIEVNGKRNEDAAWTYPAPKQEAAEIKDHVAFWKGIEVID
jgi:uncharacterized protein (DUF427 family)